MTILHQAGHDGGLMRQDSLMFSSSKSCRNCVKTHVNCVAVLVSEAVVVTMSHVSSPVLVVTRCNFFQWRYIEENDRFI